MVVTKEKITQYAKFYYDHLVNDIMSFWEPRTGDEEFGGYLSSFDRKGKLTSELKNMWVQGRQLWMFSALYNRLEAREEWYRLARLGRDFIVKNGYAEAGRWYYRLDREGKIETSNLSYFTDSFVLMGLSEFARASGSDQDFKLIKETFEGLESHIHQSDFDQFYHFKVDNRNQYHGPHMIGVNVGSVLLPVLGEEKVGSYLDYCLEKVLYTFARDEERILFEMLGRDGKPINTPEGQMINPGHILESVWFCFEEGRRRDDQAIIDRCVKIIDWILDKGFDNEQGGIFAFIDTKGGKPYVPEVLQRLGETWDAKIWWVHSEALYTLALCALIANRKDLWNQFQKIQEYTQQYFFDSEYGEWYMYLNRDGTLRKPDKGTTIKSAYHVPRNMLFLYLLFKEIS